MPVVDVLVFSCAGAALAHAARRSLAGPARRHPARGADCDVVSTLVGGRLRSRRLARRLALGVWTGAAGVWVLCLLAVSRLDVDGPLRLAVVGVVAAVAALALCGVLCAGLRAIANATRVTVVAAGGVLVAEGFVRGRRVGRLRFDAADVTRLVLAVSAVPSRDGVATVARTEVVVQEGRRRVPVAYTDRETEGTVLWDLVDVTLMSVAEIWATELGADFVVGVSPRDR